MTTEKDVKKEMASSEEIRELRRWLREDSKKSAEVAAQLHTKIDTIYEALHRKMDQCNTENQKEHADLNAKISEQNTKTGVNTAKLGLFVSLLTIVVAAIASSGFAHLAGVN